MNFFTRLLPHAWILVLLGAIAAVCRIASVNLARAEELSNLAGGDAIVVDADSMTGYAGGVRKLVLPEQRHESAQWIAQTQRMLAAREWRIRHIDADNAPAGRTTYAPSPYRWWLGLVAWVDRLVHDGPLGLAVERAAILAGPALLVLLLVGATLFAVRYFGALAAVLFPAALLFGFPLAGNFLSPMPGDAGLIQVLVCAALLPLGAALAQPRSAAEVRGLFVFGGVAAGGALWVDVGPAVVLVLGVAIGGLCVAWLDRGRGEARAAALPWRAWAWAGAGASVVAYVLEYAPAHLAGWRLDRNHPLYALAWFGVGELLARGGDWLTAGRRPVVAKEWLALGGAGAAVLALPIGLLLTSGRGAFGYTGHLARPALTPGSGLVPDLFSWFFDASALQVWAVLFPLAILGPAVWLWWSRPAMRVTRAVALLAGPALVLAGFGVWQVALWASLEVALLVLLGVLTARGEAPRRAWCVGAWCAAVAVAVVPAALTLWPKSAGLAANAVSEAEFDGLMQRDLAHWLAARAPEGGAVVLAPAAMSSALHFFGGVRGLVTPDPENYEGFAAAVRLCAASSADEAEVLSRNRQLTYIVVPSWDKSLDEYARLGTNGQGKTLVALLHDWLPPRWLQAVPFVVPQSEGLGERSLALFEVTELQEQAAMLARLAEYFLEMNRLQEAGYLAMVLEKSFAEDSGALIARAEVAGTLGAQAELERTLRALEPVLERGEDADLPWDRRVALAILLAQVRKADLAKPRIEECLATMDAERLRRLSTLTLFRLQMVARAYGLAIEDPELQVKARALLPAEMRARL